MRPPLVVLFHPGIDDFSNLVESEELIEVHDFVAIGSIEAFAERVLALLPRLRRGNQYSVVATPCCEYLAEKLWSIGDPQYVRQDAHRFNPFESADQAVSAKRGANLDGNAFRL